MPSLAVKVEEASKLLSDLKDRCVGSEDVAKRSTGVNNPLHKSSHTLQLNGVDVLAHSFTECEPCYRNEALPGFAGNRRDKPPSSSSSSRPAHFTDSDDAPSQPDVERTPRSTDLFPPPDLSRGTWQAAPGLDATPTTIGLVRDIASSQGSHVTDTL